MYNDEIKRIPSFATRVKFFSLHIWECIFKKKNPPSPIHKKMFTCTCLHHLVRWLTLNFAYTSVVLGAVSYKVWIMLLTTWQKIKPQRWIWIRTDHTWWLTAIFYHTVVYWSVLSPVGSLLFVRIIKVHVSKYEGEKNKWTMGRWWAMIVLGFW